MTTPPHLPDASGTAACRQLVAACAAAICVAAFPLSLRAQPPADSAPRPRRGVLPLLGYAETTGLQYGATAFRIFRAGGKSLTRPSTDGLYFAHTAKGHTKAFAQVERWSADNRRYYRIRGDYISYPLPFFGVGADAPEAAEEWYSSGVTTVHTFAQLALREGTFLLIGYRNVRSVLREAETGGLVTAAVGRDSSTSLGVVQIGLVRDSRDDLGAPRRGTFARIIASLSGRIEEQHKHQRLTVDARHYFPVGAGQVIAAQVQYDGIGGSATFDQLPMIGADTAARGYARGRFRDEQAVTAQVEFRTGYWRRLGLVAFAGAGAVAPRAFELASTRWHPSAGLGARVLFSPRQRSLARLDLGFGRRSVALSLGLNEAF